HEGDQFPLVDINGEGAFGGNRDGILLTMLVDHPDFAHQRRACLGEIGKQRPRHCAEGAEAVPGEVGVLTSCPAADGATAGLSPPGAEGAWAGAVAPSLPGAWAGASALPVPDDWAGASAGACPPAAGADDAASSLEEASPVPS